MTDPNTLYQLTPRDWRADLTPKIFWPGGSRPSRFGNEIEAVLLHFAFAGPVHVEDAGPYGTMVYLGTGEDVFSNQMTALPLGDDVPEWFMFTQPSFARSQAEAEAMDTEWYYTTDAAQILAARPQYGARTFPAPWDLGFPVTTTHNPAAVAYGWIQHRKAKFTLGNNQSHMMRYDAPKWIPPSMTGTGHGAILTNDGTFAGPFIGNSGKPSNINDTAQNQGGLPNYYASSSYCAETDLWPDGKHKVFLRALDTTTKQWTRLESAPLPQNWVAGEVNRGASLVDRVAKRVYYKDGGQYYYVDLTNGLAGATMSARSVFTFFGPPEATWASDYNSGSGPLHGHPTRRLMYQKNLRGDGTYNNALQLFDFDNGTAHWLNLESKGLDFGTVIAVGIHYDAGTNKVILTWKERYTRLFKYATFTVPGDPTNIDNYTDITTTTLSFAPGAVNENIEYTMRFNEHGKYYPDLGVIVWQQLNERPLVFMPA